MYRTLLLEKELPNGYSVRVMTEEKFYNSQPHSLIVSISTGKDCEKYDAYFPYVPGKKTTYVSEKYYLNGKSHHREDVTKTILEALSECGYSWDVGSVLDEFILDQQGLTAYVVGNESIVILREFDDAERAKDFYQASTYFTKSPVSLGTMAEIRDISKRLGKPVEYHRGFKNW